MAPRGWTELDLRAGVHQNSAPQTLRRKSAFLENAFINRAGAHTPFPGLREVVDFPVGTGNIYVTQHEFQNDLICVGSNGSVFRVHTDYTFDDVTGTPASGGGRAVFAQSSQELMIATGGDIIRLAQPTTDILSADAPTPSTHVVHLESFAIALESNTGLFFQSEAGDARSWDPLDVFATTVKPDNVISLAVTPRLSLYAAGPKSIEQFEANPNGVAPFFRRRAIGVGIQGPYLLTPTDRGTFGVTQNLELVRLSELSGRPLSDDISVVLEDIDDWTGAWLEQARIKGHEFMILQMPNATNRYGTTGVTFAYEYRLNRWSELFGYDEENAQPVIWPGVSVGRAFDKTFVGGVDKLYLWDKDHHAYGAQKRITRWRSGVSLADRGHTEIADARILAARGKTAGEGSMILRRLGDDGKVAAQVTVSMGSAADTNIAVRSMGAMGEGTGHVFEYEISDAIDWELSDLLVKVVDKDQ